MAHLSLSLASFLLLGAVLFGQVPPAEPLIPSAASLQIEDEPGLPRVLLVGDSISLGYTRPVRERLRGQANVHHPAENCGDTGRGLKKLATWLGDRPWDVIVFNFGLHDLKYLDAAGKYVSPSEGQQVTPLPRYEANLRELVSRLKKTGAKLFFATTTPVPDDSLGRVAHDERAYNETAQRVMADEKIPVVDLWSAIVPRQSDLQLPHNVHFTKEGYELLGDAVTANIRPLLPPKR